MLGIPECCRMSFVNFPRHFFKCWNYASLPASFCQRIATLTCDLSEPYRFFPSLSQRDKGQSAQSNIASFASDYCTEHPTLCARVIYNEVQPVSIGISPWFCIADFDSRK